MMELLSFNASCSCVWYQSEQDVSNDIFSIFVQTYVHALWCKLTAFSIRFAVFNVILVRQTSIQYLTAWIADSAESLKSESESSSSPAHLESSPRTRVPISVSRGEVRRGSTLSVHIVLSLRAISSRSHVARRMSHVADCNHSSNYRHEAFDEVHCIELFDIQVADGQNSRLWTWCSAGYSCTHWWNVT